MRIKLLLLLLSFASLVDAQKRKTIVSITGQDFYIDGKITLDERKYNGMRLEGLLPNSRMVQGIFDDYNPQTKGFWKYPDTQQWDAERNTNEFVSAMTDWKNHGLLAFTLN